MRLHQDCYPSLKEKVMLFMRRPKEAGFKDTSRMLDAGAAKVYFAKVWDDQLSKYSMKS